MAEVLPTGTERNLPEDVDGPSPTGPTVDGSLSKVLDAPGSADVAVGDVASEVNASESDVSVGVTEPALGEGSTPAALLESNSGRPDEASTEGCSVVVLPLVGVLLVNGADWLVLVSPAEWAVSLSCPDEDVHAEQPLADSRTQRRSFGVISPV